VNHTPDTTTADNGGNFDPQQAAALLDQTTQQARRRIEPFPPWLLTVRAFIALAIYGTVWLSVRGQHPFQHPTAVVAPVVVVLVVVNLVATLTIAKRATTGVTGRSRLRPPEIAIMIVIWLVVFVVLAVLAAAGASNAIVYGIYPATVPLMAAGLAWAAIMATRANWRASSTAIACVIVGAAAIFAGPAGAYLVGGIGLCLVLLGAAVAIAWRQRRSVVRP
jgi:hypothetical protein